MPYATRDQISHLLKLTPRMVNMHVKEHGMPCAGRGEYDMVACVQWYIGYLKEQIDRARRGDETEQQARARLIKATANLRELEYAREQSKLIPVEVVRVVWERLTIAFKNKILSLPSKLPQRLIGCQDINQIKSVLESEVYEALGELSATEIDVSTLPESEGTDSADHTARRSSSQTHREPMGGQGENPEPGVKRRTGKVADGPGRVPKRDHGRSDRPDS